MLKIGILGVGGISGAHINGWLKNHCALRHPPGADDRPRRKNKSSLLYQF